MTKRNLIDFLCVSSGVFVLGYGLTLIALKTLGAQGSEAQAVGALLLSAIVACALALLATLADKVESIARRLAKQQEPRPREIAPLLPVLHNKGTPVTIMLPDYRSKVMLNLVNSETLTLTVLDPNGQILTQKILSVSGSVAF